MFSPDGKLIVTVNETRLFVWEVMTRQKILTMETAGAIEAAAITATGRVLAVEAPRGNRPPAAFVNLRDVGTHQSFLRLQVSGNYIHAITFSRDGRRIAASMDDSSILIWDLERLGIPDKRKSEELDAKKLDCLWDDLASNEAPSAYRAMETFLSSPVKTIAYFRSHFLGDTDRNIARLLVKLDDTDATVRQAAIAELTRLGRRIEPGLRAALRDRPSLELRRRIETLLLQVNGQEPETEVLRCCRAIHILECIDSPPARDLLETLSRGASGGFTTEEAKSALKRASKN